jgi:hypothetical protein
MSPTIRVDEQVYQWLQSQAIPFDDTPNSVLRRIAGLSGDARPKPSDQSPQPPPQPPAQAVHTDGRRARLARGNELISRWKIPAREARFRRDGTWFASLTKFPAALCDCSGYLILETLNAFRQHPEISVHPSGQITVTGGVSAVRGYVKVDDPIDDPYDLKQ